MRAHILAAGMLVLVPLASGCVRARAATAESSPAPSARAAVLGVAGDCPSGSGPMLPAAAASLEADRNHDGYVCPTQVASITGGTLRLYVDDDAKSGAEVAMAFYGGM